jgi:hypothetical protein
MAVVRRIFSLIGGEGEALYGTARTLEREGIPSPSGNRVWVKPTVKDIILDDAYRTLSYDELEDLVSEGNLTADVLSRLDPDERYGIWWFNRSHKTLKLRVVVHNDGTPEVSGVFSGVESSVKRNAVQIALYGNFPLQPHGGVSPSANKKLTG